MSEPPKLSVSLRNPDKARAYQQWTIDPCGSSTSQQPLGTREFFEQVERYRYQEYAPWMPAVMGFARFASQRLLEVGCGLGTDLLQFARAGASVCGTDLTPCSVALTRQRFALYHLPGWFLVCDAEALCFPDEFFDVVYSNGVLHHLPDTAQAVAEIHRVLRPGGVAKVMLYHRHSLHYWLNLFFRIGVLRGELRRKSMSDILREYVEYSTSGARPLVKVYTRRQARRLFHAFRHCRVQVRQLSLPIPLPQPLRRALHGLLAPLLGWNIILTATK